VRRHAQEVAIDYHDRPYYGKVPQAQGLWVRGHAKAGTTRFYRIATAYLRRRRCYQITEQGKREYTRCCEALTPLLRELFPALHPRG
jgi:hypothetical protein